jgi:putative pyruvate formate lyase activating enzyme
MINCGEEDGLNPSHQVYFTGCNLKCEFCTVAEWNEEPEAAPASDIQKMAERIAERQLEGAKTLNLLGGEPAVNVYGILQLLRLVDPSVCVVWNSNMYYNPVIDELMKGLVDIYLADLKCGNSQCSEKLLGSGDYAEVARGNIIRAKEHSEVILRHLVLPEHFECCTKPVLTWISQNVQDVKLSLRTDYIPPAAAVSAPKSYLSNDEIEIVTDFAEQFGLNMVQ